MIMIRNRYILSCQYRTKVIGILFFFNISIIPYCLPLAASKCFDEEKTASQTLQAQPFTSLSTVTSFAGVLWSPKPEPGWWLPALVIFRIIYFCTLNKLSGRNKEYVSSLITIFYSYPPPHARSIINYHNKLHSL